MNVRIIKLLVDNGIEVYWSTTAYRVIKDSIGQYLIHCIINDHYIGLTHIDGHTLNGKAEEFFCYNWDNFKLLAKELSDNFPECALTLQCIGWDYEAGEFKFRDNEGDGQEYTLEIDDLAAGVALFYKGLGKEWYFQYVNAYNEHEDVMDIACQHDGLTIDAIMQLAIFGDISYG